jgi:Family of unknown function (DUF6152)
MRGYLITAVSAALAVLGGQAQAHHSGAMFDPAKELKITGTIQEFVWTNPHSSFKVQILDSSGGVATWAVEMSSPNNLVREGWKRTTLKVGDTVTVTVHPLRDGIPGGQYLSIVLADGSRLGGDQKPEAPGSPGN